MKHAHYINDDYNLVQLPIIYSSKQVNQRTSQKLSRPIVVNLGDTQYQVVEEVCDELGWRIQYSDTKSWDIKWIDTAVSSDFVNKMSQHQKVNHFPGMNILSRKNNLTKCIHKMQEKYPEDYDFYPVTFLLPFDKHKLRAYVQQLKKEGKRKIFIVKPQASSQGRGIFLTQNINEIQQYSHCLVQKYVPNPLLYKGLKFDLRVYALVAGCDPLRIYIYNEGLTRFATQRYEHASEDNLDNMYMHLTNYAINKDHPNYIYNDSVENLSYGHKKSLAEFFQTLKNLGLKAHQYWADIKDIIIKTMISGQPHLQHEYRISQPHNLKNNMCFEVLGFDFMIDANNKCYLLEINHTPSFTTDTPLDQLVKNNLIRDTLILMNINPKSRDKILSEMKSQNQRRVFTGKIKKYAPEQRQRQVNELQKEREEWEKNHLGSFQKIYPSKNPMKQQKYEQLLQYSMDCFRQTTHAGRSRQSPLRFRVKKLLTSHTNDEDESNNRSSSIMNNQNNSNKSTLIGRGQTSSLNRNVSTVAKINEQNLSKDQSQKREGPLSPQKELQLQNINIKQPTKRKNPIMVGSIVSRGKLGEEQYTPEFGSNTLNSVKKIDTSHKMNNNSLKEIREIYEKERWNNGGFLRTKQEQSTMFSKMLQRTRE